MNLEWLEVFMEYRVDIGIKNMEKREKTHILDIFGSCVPVHLECVPVHPSRIQSVPVMLCSQFQPVFVLWT